MIRHLSILPLLSIGMAFVSLFVPEFVYSSETTKPITVPAFLPTFAVLLMVGLIALKRRWGELSLVVAVLGLSFTAVALVEIIDMYPFPVGPAWGWQLAAYVILAMAFIQKLAAWDNLPKYAAVATRLAVPVLFGLLILYLWEAVVLKYSVPVVLLPAPSAIAARLVGSLPILWADFRQTFLKAVIAGYVLGCGSGFLAAILIDRSSFLKKGLLPIGNFVSALPIIGVAPIMVMWFGFDWSSKAAVVVIMTFFPMLVNTVAGLSAAGAMERDLMRTYGADERATLMKLRLPAAMPFVFNALKINSTLALIGAIVAEFFGTPIVGMGFRISAEIGRLNTDMVWAEIVVAAIAGSLFYALVAAFERLVTFWHPSMRGA